MKPKAIVYRKMDPGILEDIRNYCDVTSFDKLDDDSLPAFRAALADAEGLLGSGLRVDRELLEMAPRLRIVCNNSVGYDNLDLQELERRGIMASNTPEVLNETVADAVFGLILAAARRIPELDRAIREGRWTEHAGSSWFGVDVHGKTLGIIGMGGIGASIARRAKFGFGMKVMYHNRSRKPEYEAAYETIYGSLDDLLRESDYVVIMTPLTPQTRHLIGEREFGLMKRSAIFINASRGATIDEEALIRALQTGLIRGAGLDVFEQEPIQPDHPFLTMDQVMMLPHMGSATRETRYKMARLAADNLIAGLTGGHPPSLIRRKP
ncbi:2-hydroxyacid dehydrogenase [Gorillibacterium sp. sgz5001074]|uniref:2-hydroxyacid dehydrogenase n=1 Tax=Gorillibacterium sp. sgz5001074 TaxID=3446695 RepID=UPI003F672BE4